jgi:hypothetical protein
MGAFPRERPANAALPAEGERRDSNPRPPGHNQGLGSRPPRLVSALDRFIGGLRVDRATRRACANPVRYRAIPLVSGPIPALGPKTHEDAPCYGRGRTSGRLISTRPGPPASSTGRDPHESERRRRGVARSWNRQAPTVLSGSIPALAPMGSKYPRPASADQRAAVGITRREHSPTESVRRLRVRPTHSRARP